MLYLISIASRIVRQKCMYLSAQFGTSFRARKIHGFREVISAYSIRVIRHESNKSLSFLVKIYNLMTFRIKEEVS